jgi:Acetyltransferase (GNAT) family
VALQNQRRPGQECARPPSKGGLGWPVGQLEADCGADCHTGQVTSPHLTIGRAASDDELTEFWLFANEVYAQRPAHWVTTPGDLVPLLKGQGPTAAGRSTLPLVARSNGRIVARAAALVDEHYIGRWNEPLGHVVLFEALPGSADAVRALMDEACGWLRAQGLEAARTGFGGNGVDWPFTIDAYDLLPSPAMRQNPPYYHSLLAEARFDVERRLVDYKIEVTPELVERWEQMLRAAEASGFRVRSFSEADKLRRVEDFWSVWETAFSRHWGCPASSLAEWEHGFAQWEPVGAHETSVVAYRGDEPVGVTLCFPFASSQVRLVGDRQLLAEEHLNWFGIAVLESARGTGLNLAIAARTYLELVNRGAPYVNYGHVLDDNWPSRRTGEKLGGRVGANYLVYRRDLLRAGKA